MEDILVLKSYWGEVCIHIQLSDINSKSFRVKKMAISMERVMVRWNVTDVSFIIASPCSWLISYYDANTAKAADRLSQCSRTVTLAVFIA